MASDGYVTLNDTPSMDLITLQAYWTVRSNWLLVYFRKAKVQLSIYKS
jgi:hypothetical protein